MNHLGTMHLGNFLCAVGAAVDGEDDFDQIREWFGSGLDRLQAAGEAFFFVSGRDEDGKSHLRLPLPLAT
jgi:hypothetical protein